MACGFSDVCDNVDRAFRFVIDTATLTRRWER